MNQVLIYTSSHFRLQKLTKMSPCAPNSTAITAYIFLRLHLTNPLPLDRSFFAFVLCFYDKKSSKKQQCGENASIGVNYELLSANVKRPAGLLLSDPRVSAELLGCGTLNPLYLIGDAASRRGLCTGRVFHPAQRPVERAPA